VERFILSVKLNILHLITFILIMEVLGKDNFDACRWRY